MNQPQQHTKLFIPLHQEERKAHVLDSNSHQDILDWFVLLVFFHGLSKGTVGKVIAPFAFHFPFPFSSSCMSLDVTQQ